jgi:hypothetical protein
MEYDALGLEYDALGLDIVRLQQVSGEGVKRMDAVTPAAKLYQDCRGIVFEEKLYKCVVNENLRGLKG